MDNPRARRNNLFSERLGDETIIYDKLNHKAHTLNKTVATIWESAEGDKSVDELAGVLHHELDIPVDSGVVLLALEQLKGADLLETAVEVDHGTERSSRREVARRLALAGASAALVPFVASVLAPTPAMADSEGAIPT